jgi:hypothetical protein
MNFRVTCSFLYESLRGSTGCRDSIPGIGHTYCVLTLERPYMMQAPQTVSKDHRHAWLSSFRSLSMVTLFHKEALSLEQGDEDAVIPARDSRSAGIFNISRPSRPVAEAPIRNPIPHVGLSVRSSLFVRVRLRVLL